MVLSTVGRNLRKSLSVPRGIFEIAIYPGIAYECFLPRRLLIDVWHPYCRIDTGDIAIYLVDRGLKHSSIKEISYGVLLYLERAIDAVFDRRVVVMDQVQSDINAL